MCVDVDRLFSRVTCTVYEWAEIREFSRPVWERTSSIRKIPWGGLSPLEVSFLGKQTSDYHVCNFVQLKNMFNEMVKRDTILFS